MIYILLAVLLGYYLGWQRYQKDTKEIKKRIGKAKAIVTGKVKKIGRPSSGIVYRPTAKTINKWKAEGTPVSEAFKDLDSLPEIQEAKKILKK